MARHEPDPIRRLEQDLEAEQKAVAAQLAAMKAELNQIKNPPPAAPQETVWRAPQKTDPERSPVAAPGRPTRVHSAQRRRDRTKFIGLLIVFVIVLIWLIRLL